MPAAWAAAPSKGEPMKRLLAPMLALALVALAACGGSVRERTVSGSPGPEAGLAGEGGSITVYSGRGENLVGPVIEQFRQATGVEVDVRYGDTAELAATILEEGDNSPADLFFAQDAGALGALAKAGRFVPLPGDFLDRVPPGFRSKQGLWVGISGRVRTVVYNTDRLKESDLPDSILDFTDSRWNGRVGWAPTNGSFQAFVTALRVLKGDPVARQWLSGMKASGAQAFSGNSAIVKAVAAGELDAGFVNHYYALEVKRTDPGLKAANYFLPGGDPGALINVAGAGILKTSTVQATAGRLLDFLLSDAAQQYFASKTFEYPLLARVAPDPSLPPLEAIRAPDVDLSDLADLQGTLTMLKEVGVL